MYSTFVKLKSIDSSPQHFPKCFLMFLSDALAVQRLSSIVILALMRKVERGEVNRLAWGSRARLAQWEWLLHVKPAFH